ncbi:MAG: GNAT family N-acetyltransferase [Candidatus Odinarchaeota archaeon]
MIKRFTSSLKGNLEKKDARFREFSPYLDNYVLYSSGNRAIGMITIKKEPVVFLAPRGTKLAELHVFQENLKHVEWKELETFSKLEGVAFLIISLSRQAVEDISIVKEQGMEKYESSVEMAKSDLQRYRYDESHYYQYQVNSPENFDWYFDMVQECLNGSQDERAQRILERISHGEKVFDYNRMKIWMALTTVYVYKPGGKITGFVELNHSKQRLMNIGVMPEFRGKGHGKAILEFILTKTVSLGLKSLELRLSENNHVARKLYDRYGFIEKERKDHYWLVGLKTSSI